ncbi:hypothetical protein [Burkholderia anthina]|uniref:hypothetical protein n=1 Tax=Burkholderia anthina TaxID=179879 RepID=UPI0037BEF052
MTGFSRCVPVFNGRWREIRRRAAQYFFCVAPGAHALLFAFKRQLEFAGLCTARIAKDREAMMSRSTVAMPILFYLPVCAPD